MVNDVTVYVHMYKTHQIQVFQSRSNAFHHILAIRVAVRTWVQRRMETTANFPDAALQLLSLEKRDEHRFKNLITLKQSAKLTYIYQTRLY